MIDIHESIAEHRMTMNQSDYCDWADEVMVALAESNRSIYRGSVIALSLATLGVIFQFVSLIVRYCL